MEASPVVTVGGRLFGSSYANKKMLARVPRVTQIRRFSSHVAICIKRALRNYLRRRRRRLLALLGSRLGPPREADAVKQNTENRLVLAGEKGGRNKTRGDRLRKPRKETGESELGPDANMADSRRH